MPTCSVSHKLPAIGAEIEVAVYFSLDRAHDTAAQTSRALLIVQFVLPDERGLRRIIRHLGSGVIRALTQNIWDLRAPVSVELDTGQHGAALRSAATVRARRQCEEHIRRRYGRVASLVKRALPGCRAKGLWEGPL